MAQRTLKACTWIIKLCIRRRDSTNPFIASKNSMGIRKRSSHFEHNMKLNSWSNLVASIRLTIKLCMCVNMYDEFLDPRVFCISNILFFLFSHLWRFIVIIRFLAFVMWYIVYGLLHFSSHPCPGLYDERFQCFFVLSNSF